MKIGILTFHSQLNYGGVLQCWALQTVLEKMGHEVVVIDREFEHQIRSIWAIFKDWSAIDWLKFIIKLILLKPSGLRIFRYINTVKFVRHNIHLTPYSFKDWANAPKELGVDLIIVGSDQVWNGIWQDPRTYLLEDVQNIPGIGYAISLGMKELPDQYLQSYKAASSRFAAVSVREKEAGAVLSRIGFNPQWVVDPVLLNYDNWHRAANSHNSGLVCYFIASDILCEDVMSELEEFSRSRRMPVDIYLQQYGGFRLKAKNVTVHYTSGPREFYKAIASATCVVTDSFHGLAFSAIFYKNVRVIKPTNENRAMMFARIQEFIGRYVIGECASENISYALSSIASGLRTIIRQEQLRLDIQESAAWLRAKIAQAIR